MAKKFKKILILAVIFSMTVVNYGLPLQAIAAEGESFFSFAFFKKNEISLDAYFANDLEKIEDTTNVNETAKITLEVSPQIEGYLKSGILKFNLKNGNENNFKLLSVTIDEKEEIKPEDSKEVNIDKPESGVNEEETVFEEVIKKDEEQSEGSVFESVIKKDDIQDVSVKDENLTTSNPFSGLFKNDKEGKEDKNEIASEKDEVAENTVEEEKEEENPKAESEENVEKKPEEEKDISEVIEEVRGTYEVSLCNENEIALKNIIEPTKIYVEVGYKKLEKINPQDIVSEIEILLNGNYINKKLETLEVNRKQYLKLGWEYSKDIKVDADFVKVSPFTVGKNSGTIIENEIIIARNIEDNNYLPIKETNIKIEIPKINDKLPIAVNVAANKLMATLGKDLTGKEFNKNNWTFDKESGILEIKVINREMFAGNGEDKFNIICRYEDYLEEEKIELNKNVLVKVEEYTSNKNNVQEVKIEEVQEKEVVAGELMSYTTIENEESIVKGKLNANYHIEAGDTKFASTVNVTVLTSDILNEIVIEPVKEVYKASDEEVEFDATQEVMYAGIEFKLAEIKEMLEQGSTIDLLDADGNVFHTISKEVDATKIEFLQNIDDLKVRINNVKVNGNLSISFIKAINKSQYSQSDFVGFEKIENTYKASVKYVGFEEVFQLPEIKDELKFVDSITQVNLIMSTSSLSTLHLNENVEFKVDLLNNMDTSDIYKNPSFEIVFPSFVKDVSINNIYTLFQNGLSIRDYDVIDIEGLKRIVINLDGVQNGFDFSNITNGTNVIVNANIRVDELTPQRKDQIELYYCNEAATNYQTQAGWNMTRGIPENSIKDTNGYDATIFEYQAPSGLVTVNSIMNYDGTGETIKSINQGEIIKTIPVKGEIRRATMELFVLNNTGSDCTDMFLLGRIPFKGNKDVYTGEDLGTNVDSIMKSFITSDELNSTEAKIYYSSNPNANKDLEDETNGWVESFSPIENVKSFMIVIDEPFVAGGILKYKYEFEIPSNLGYEVKMLGSFGAFYKELDLFKISVADKVGLLTEAGVKYEATMSVDIGEGTEIGESKYLKYKVAIKNTGSVDLNNIKIENSDPNFGRIQNPEGIEEGKYVFYIDKVLVGETKEKEIVVKTTRIPKNLRSYAMTLPNIKEEIEEDGSCKYSILDENNERIYITELPKEFYIENFATVYVEDTINGKKTNVVKNKLKETYLDVNVDEYNDKGILNPGEEFEYIIDVHNISEEIINNINIEYIIPKELTYLETKQVDSEYVVEFDTDDNKLNVIVGSLNPLETARIFVKCKVTMKNIGKATIYNLVTVTADNDIKETGNIFEHVLLGPELIITQETNKENNSVLEMEEFQIIANINNKGEAQSQLINFEIEIPKEFEIVDIESEGKRIINYTIEDNVIIGKLNLLEEHDVASLVIKAMAEPLNEGETNSVFEIKSKFLENFIGELDVKPLEIVVLDNPDRELTQEEKDKVEQDNTIDNPVTEDPNLNIGTNKDNNTNVDSKNENNNPSNPSLNNNQNNQQQENVEKENEEEKEEKEEEKEEKVKTFKISGQVFKDVNKNNAKDNNEEGIGQVQVKLYKGSKEIKTILTDSLGKYRFTEVEIGDYTVVFNYKSDAYIASKYKYTSVAESMNSDAIESEEGIAVTENIKLTDSDVEIDLGLQERNTFDIEVKKYISKAVVTRKGKEKVQNYNNEAIAKLEIRSKELADTTIDLEYKIVVTNKGDISGTVGSVYDYLPNSLTFDKNLNKDWELTEDNILENKSLNKEVIKPGESKELKLVLNKVMTNDNTGTISNKVEIGNITSDKVIEEEKENNIATQEIIITISTGRTISIVVFLVLIIIATVLIYGIKTGKIKKAYK